MDNFHTLGLAPALMRALDAMKFEKPTPIQSQAIPPALEGKDILGSAQTGTGKTGAFGIPLVNRLLSNSRGSALVLLPTRELAMQVEESLKLMLGKLSPIKTALLIGGDSMPQQVNQLRARPRIIVGTPGRINDHLERGTLMLHDASFLVLDETDRMLDMGFEIQLERIFKYLPKVRQTLMFSATLPPNIIKLSSKYLHNPVRVAVGSTNATAAKVTQENINTTQDAKYGELIKQLEARTGSVIIFVKTKWGTEKLAKRLCKDKHNADAIHGDLRQNQRERAIQNFRDMKHRILVATDIAARGLDIPHIEHVINYDLPQVPEDYIHRIGRTGRAGAEGSAVNLLTSEDGEKWRAISRLLGNEVKPEEGKPSPGGAAKRRNRKRGSRNSRGFRPSGSSAPKVA